ncbi:uncharacterized protein LOC122655019 [Telopea speciosissima]|uniref:uncharacterized protein LOC122655019 n=1 Tax=Telopea speciosissima TaxID=54955 RepID=UPI001CC79CB8|nr:uncharacterized protein LOC122655019 [Telopea speciosissima]
MDYREPRSWSCFDTRNILISVSYKSSICCALTPGSRAKDPDGKTSHKFHILWTTSFCCASGRSISCKSENLKPTNGIAKLIFLKQWRLICLTWRNLLFSQMKKFILQLMISLIQIYLGMGLMVLSTMEFFETKWLQSKE